MQNLTGSNDTPLAGVREGMRVIDAADQEIGKVELIRMGDPEAVTGEGQRQPTDLLTAAAEAIVPDEREPDVPAPLRSRLVRSGFIKVDGPGLADTDRYVTPDRVREVREDRVYLNVRKEQLPREE
jgi:hypothetical protein